MYRVLFVAAVASVWVQAAHADLILHAPAGLAAGQQFQIVFVTDGTTLAESSDISTYNAFVNSDANAQAGGSVFYNGHVVTFSAIGSTATVSEASNIGANNAPVYMADGTLIANSTTPGGLWTVDLGGGISIGHLQAGINEDLLGHPSTAGLVWTGSLSDGTAAFNAELGSATTVTALGFIGHTGADWDGGGAHAFDEGLPMYAISNVLTAAAIPEPSSMLLTLMGLGSAFGWRLARRRNSAD
jgi:hypothetical protein